VGGRYDRVGAKASGLWVKWRRSRQFGMRENKKSNGGEERERRGRCIVERKRKTILLSFAGARFLTLYLFFFINNRV
jgi:hypothetical protein